MGGAPAYPSFEPASHVGRAPSCPCQPCRDGSTISFMTVSVIWQSAGRVWFALNLAAACVSLSAVGGQSV